MLLPIHFSFFFFNDTATTEIYTLSLHDALPIWRITIPLTLSNLKLLRRITRTENILHRNFTRRQVAIQNRVASNIGISQSTFSVKVLNLFSRSRRKTRFSTLTLKVLRSEERFSRNAETDLVCRLLLEKKKRNQDKKPP